MSHLRLPDTSTMQKRAWIHGFVAGFLGIEPSMDAFVSITLDVSADDSTGDSDQNSTSADVSSEDFPWHDPALPIVDRIQMAEGKPLERQLMAAMAQLDCGSCGYLCQTYSEAIASGEEPSLTLCSPGGNETKRMLKKLIASHSGVAKSESARTVSSDDSGWSRRRPFLAKFVESRGLNRPGSSKDTRHVVIDLSGSELKYEVGDALGLYPTNCGELVKAILETLRLEADANIDSRDELKTLSAVLTETACLRDPSDELMELVMSRCDSAEHQAKLADWIDRGPESGTDVLDVLKMADRPISANELADALGQLNPRLYSIASSMAKVGNEVHLTVGTVTYEREGRLRKGVASTMLAERIQPGQACRVYIQPNHAGFTVPADSAAPMIMVGPGTGIAPFMAFLQQREATKATGKNWLFFGDQHRDTDFLYEERLCQYQKSGLLDRLDTAFSRDGDSKVYVQDRMVQNGEQLWQWLADGGHFYVCGDAKRMARDVHQALFEIVAQHGNLSSEQAEEYVAKMQADRRYVRDVY